MSHICNCSFNVLLLKVLEMVSLKFSLGTMIVKSKGIYLVQRTIVKHVSIWFYYMARKN